MSSNDVPIFPPEHPLQLTNWVMQYYQHPPYYQAPQQQPYSQQPYANSYQQVKFLLAADLGVTLVCEQPTSLVHLALQ